MWSRWQSCYAVAAHPGLEFISKKEASRVQQYMLWQLTLITLIKTSLRRAKHKTTLFRSILAQKLETGYDVLLEVLLFHDDACWMKILSHSVKTLNIAHDSHNWSSSLSIHLFCYFMTNRLPYLTLAIITYKRYWNLSSALWYGGYCAESETWLSWPSVLYFFLPPIRGFLLLTPTSDDKPLVLRIWRCLLPVPSSASHRS